MRTSGPRKRPVQGKTGKIKNESLGDKSSQKQELALKKRQPFSDISDLDQNIAAKPKKLKKFGSEKPITKRKKKTKSEKVEQMQSSAFFVQDASPETSKRVMSAIRQDPGLSEILTPSRLNEGERTPCGAPKWVETSTVRKRIFDRTNDFPVQRDFADGRNKVIRGLFFTERVKNDSQEKSVRVPEELRSKPLVEQAFGPVLITQQGIKNVPPRGSLKKELQVMGGVRANDVAAEYWATDLPTNFQNSHGAGIVLAAGDVDTQVPENMYVGTDKANWSKKQYELKLRELLLKNPDRELGLLAIAELLEGTTLAQREALMYDFLRSNGNSTHGPLDFDTLRLTTESVLVSRAFGVMTDTVMDIDDEAVDQETLGNPFSPSF